MSLAVLHHHHAARLASLLALVSVGACDCEDQVRRFVSNPAPEQRRSVEEAPTAPSGPAEQEPNERPQEATPVTFRGEIRPVDGALSGPDDVDWFALRVETDDAPWLMELSVVPEGEANPAIHLGEEGEAAAIYDTAGPGEAETIPILSVGREPLRVAVRAVDGAAGDYTLRFKRRLSGGAVEGEPNDIAEQAIALSVPGEVQGFYDRPEDRDVYRLEAASDAPFGLEIGGLPKTPQIVRLFDAVPFDEPTLSLQVPPGQPARIPNVALEGEGAQGYLVLTTPGGFDREHAYRVRLTPLPELPERTLEREPNDRLAQPIDHDGSPLVGFVHGTDDVDRFVIGRPAEDAESEEVEPPTEEAPRELPDAGMAGGPDAGAPDTGGDAGALLARAPIVDLDATLPVKTPVDGLVDVRLRPLREGLLLGLSWRVGEEETQAKAASAEGEVALCGMILPAEGAELIVRPVELTAVQREPQPDYELRVSRPDSERFEIEPNQEVATADRLDPGAARSGYLTATADVDVYGFGVLTSTVEQTRRVVLEVEGKVVDHEIDLVDAEGGLVARANHGGPGAGERLAIDLPAGIYYVRIRAAASASCEPYQVTLSFEG